MRAAKTCAMARPIAAESSTFQEAPGFDDLEANVGNIVLRRQTSENEAGQLAWAQVNTT